MQEQNRFFVITILLLVILSIFHLGEALQCYKERKKGNETLLSEEIVTCKPGWVCLTFTTIIDQGIDIIRQCISPDFCELVKSSSKTSLLERIQDCKQCSTDMCNASAN